jgi:membrane-associated phospholipid phosphatase
MTAGTADPDALCRLDRTIWALVGIVAAIVLAAPLVSSFYLDWWAFAPPALATAALSAGAWFYRNRRPDPKLASGLDCTAQLIAFAAVGAPLSYLAAGAGAALPLQDALFDAVDRAMGFDWKAMLGWLNDTPFMFATLRLIYGSLLPQMVIAVLCLAFTGRLVWLRIFMLAFIIAAVVTIAISAVLPAAGVWLHYGLAEHDSRVIPVVQAVWPVYTGLRDGSLRALVAVGAEGVITFPSLHAALAMIITAAVWPIRLLRWPIVVLNSAMLVATPVDGAHYLIDVLAGVAVAAASFAAAHTIAVGRTAAAAAAGKIPQLATRKQ